MVLFLGYSGSGKTTAISHVTSALTGLGKKVGTIKHIHDKNFTIDTRGKDTWLHARAGASTIVAIAPKELTIIRKGNTENLSIDELVASLESGGLDYLLVEGLHRQLSRKRNVIRIMCARSRKDLGELLEFHGRPRFIMGRVASQMKSNVYEGIPVIRFPRDRKRALKLLR